MASSSLILDHHGDTEITEKNILLTARRKSIILCVLSARATCRVVARRAKPEAGG